MLFLWVTFKYRLPWSHSIRFAIFRQPLKFILNLIKKWKSLLILILPILPRRSEVFLRWNQKNLFHKVKFRKIKERRFAVCYVENFRDFSNIVEPSISYFHLFFKVFDKLGSFFELGVSTVEEIVVLLFCLLIFLSYQRLLSLSFCLKILFINSFHFLFLLLQFSIQFGLFFLINSLKLFFMFSYSFFESLMYKV